MDVNMATAAGPQVIASSDHELDARIAQATGEPLAVRDQEPPPIVLPDEDGNGLVSTAGTAMDDSDDLQYRRSHGGVTPDMHVAALHLAPTQEEPDSYFDVCHMEDEELQRTRTLGDRAFSSPQANPLKTVPTPGMPLFGRTRRHRTAAGVNERKHEPYAFTFDSSSSSDSDSDSSASEQGEHPERDATRQATLQQTVTAGSTAQQRGKTGRRNPYSRFKVGNAHFKTKGRLSKRDARLNISIKETVKDGYIAKAIGHTIHNHLDLPRTRRSWRGRRAEELDKEPAAEAEEDAISLASSLQITAPRPRLNIVVMVIGSRGDIQPFIKVGQHLRDAGHRVRIASHPIFRDFVTGLGLEFFSVGGDPSELMAFMVKNPGLIPNLQTIREGEIQRRRAAMAVMFEGFWRSCVNITDDEQDKESLKLLGDKPPFVADAIIANPPSMAHVHIAEKLGIPLHMMFTFPYSPTQSFGHPLANIKPHEGSNLDESYANFMSYPLVEMMIWQGLGDIVNRFRERTLGLEPVSSLWAPGALYRMKVPYTYLWSPALVPKPKDWGPEIDIAGFVFLDLAKDFKPGKELADFLDADGPPVIYIGFGSIVVDDPDAFTEMIFQATEMAGVRALVNKGWGGFGHTNGSTPDHIFMLGNTPHDWLFPKIKAAVHHGGAGTTAIGLKTATPTMIVPFFGDQPFWGAMVAEARAGAHKCIPYKKLTVDHLAEGIKQCLEPEAKINVQRIADSIAKEGDGAVNAVKSFHRALPLAGRYSMRCSILEERVAVWRLRKTTLRLSALAAELLRESGQLKWSDLKLQRHLEWNDFDGPGEPISGGVGAVTDSIYHIGEGVGMVPVRIAKHIRKHDEHQRKKLASMKRREARKKQITDAAARERSEEDTVQEDPEQNIEPVEMSEARGSLQRPSMTRGNTATTIKSVMSADPAEPLPREIVDDFAIGVWRSGLALITLPNDLHVAIAQGFHNAPRLYGDATVRKPTRIKGFKSGVTAARRELVYGVVDAWTGLIMQPVGDWRDGHTMGQKFKGLGTGLGKGVGGFVLKNVSAVLAPPAFLMKGTALWAEKLTRAPGSKAYIRKAHILQGRIDVEALRALGKIPTDQLGEERERVSKSWKVYEAMMASAYEHFRMYRPLGRYRFLRERQKWEDIGAFESVRTAEHTLKAKKQGRELEEIMATRRQEMQEAEEQRERAASGGGLLAEETNGEPHRVEKEEQHATKIAHNQQHDSYGSPESEVDSDATMVATPEERPGNAVGGAKRVVAGRADVKAFDGIVAMSTAKEISI